MNGDTTSGNETGARLPYETPQLVEIGSLAEQTQAKGTTTEATLST